MTRTRSCYASASCTRGCAAFSSTAAAFVTRRSPDQPVLFCYVNIRNLENGFGLDELDICMHAMRELITKEMTMFARVLRTRATDEIVEMAQRGFEGTNTLMLNLRRKLFLKVLADARKTKSKAKSRTR